MTAAEILDVIVVWTPFLAAGFLWNVAIAVASMAIGTPVGFLLAAGRSSGSIPLRRISAFLTAAARSFPTFVLIFYLAYVLPTEIAVGSVTLSLPGWLKASLALSVAVAGFVSDAGLSAIEHARKHEYQEAYLFLPGWTMYFLIIFMASSTASVIGVPEIVQRANTVIAAVGMPDVMLWIYLYAMAWFLIVSLPVAHAITLLRRRLVARTAPAAAARP